MMADTWLLAQGRPVLRFYGWPQETLSLGYHQAYESLPKGVHGIPWVRRPTGGRAVLHDPRELTYALVMPGLKERGLTKREDAYRYLCEFLRRGLDQLGIPLDPWELRGGSPRQSNRQSSCFASPTAADLTYQGQKLIGSAQVWREGIVLQQGSILLDPPCSRWAELWPQEDHAVTGIQEIMGSFVSRERVIQVLTVAAGEIFGIPCRDIEWDPGVLEQLQPHVRSITLSCELT